MVKVLKMKEMLFISSHGTSLVQEHPMIIPAKSQFNWLGGF
jgi:hypothetical protein